jgi:D-lactate dehydrogenase
MKIAFFDTHGFEKEVFIQANKKYSFEIDYLDLRLTAKTAGAAQGAQVVCSFVNDKLTKECIEALAQMGVGLIVLRSAGFNHVDLKAAREQKIHVARVPGYSPHAVAEFAVGLLLSLNRKIHRASMRVRELNFSLNGLVGFDLYGKTVGVVGTGKIGKIFALIMAAFGCRVLVFDQQIDDELNRDSRIRYVDFETLCKESDVISLHVPLNSKTLHLIGEKSMALMKEGVFIVNTGRGGLIDARALIDGLKSGKIGGAALDVYEEEEEIFFHDLSDQILKDDVLARLLTFPQVLITSHQAFLTIEALTKIANTTLESVDEFSKQGAVSAHKLVDLK